VNTTNWKKVHTGIKQIKASIKRGELNTALNKLNVLETEFAKRRTQSQIDTELATLDSSLRNFSGPEQAYTHCNLLYNRDWFLQELDVDYKIAVVSFLHKKWPSRNQLWQGLYKKEFDLLYLL
jgi:hypothetical protein